MSGVNKTYGGQLLQVLHACGTRGQLHRRTCTLRCVCVCVCVCVLVLRVLCVLIIAQ